MSILILEGCENPFSSSESSVTTTTTTTTVETTTQGDSQLVTLKEMTTTTANKTYEYHSANLGATFTIPEKWVNKYAIEDNENDKGVKYISFFEKDNHSYNSKGLLFKYCLYPDDSYKTSKSYNEYGTVTSDDTTYYVVSIVPVKSQYNTKSKGLTKAYKALAKEKYFNAICSSVVFDSEYTFDKNGCTTEPSETETTTAASNTESSSSSGENATTKKTTSTKNNDLVFSDISTRKLTSSDVENLSQESIQQAINDICALHGYNFTTPSIKSHYQQFSWYKPSSNFSESSFNSVEEYNYKFLQKYRK